MNSKTYLRYEEGGSFGVVASHSANLCCDASGKRVLSAGVQDVLVWHLQSGELQHRFLARDSHPYSFNDTVFREITSIALSPVETRNDRLNLAQGALSEGDQGGKRPSSGKLVNDEEKLVAAGYAGGEIRIWEFSGTKAFQCLLNGHRAAVTLVRFSGDGARLVSGSSDTDLVVWDIVAQTGLFRLRGHKQEITDAWFLEKQGSVSGQLMSSSRDSLLKLWDLDTQHCAHTFVGHRAPVWALAPNKSGTRMLTVSSDNLLRCFALEDDQDVRASKRQEQDPTKSAVALVGDDRVATEAGAPWRLMRGSLQRSSAERAITVQYSKDFQFVGVQTAGKTLEVYRVRSPVEVEKKIKRRLKRSREKENKKKTHERQPQLEEEQDEENNDEEDNAEDDARPHLSDELELIGAIRTDHRMRSFDFARSGPRKLDMVVSFNSNCIEVYTMEHGSADDDDDDDSKKNKKRAREVELKRSRAIELQGHRNDIRALAISSDDTLVLTVASGAAKLWNVQTKNCIRTFPSGYSLCCAFVPGDMHALVGTKTGHILLLELSSGQVLSEVAAHDDAIWSIDVRPDGRGFCTGSADKQVKFWEFEMTNAREGSDQSDNDSSSDSGSGSDSDSDSGSDSGSSSSQPGDKKDHDSSSDDEAPADKKVRSEPEANGNNSNDGGSSLDFVHTRTLKMTEDVMCVRYSHHKGTSRLLLAISLLDCTVKVFFEDSLKFALSLYGHKLPVLSMDISDDNTLIATASADKNVKVWGLDFGDCHKSFFAHDDSVMSVKFVPRTHYFFTGGKDNRIRYWDADRFEMILSLESHVGEVWGLAVASDGAFLVSSGHDKALRVWERTQDIVFPDEEREKELEKNFDAKLVSGGGDNAKVGTLAVDAVKQQQQGGVLVDSAAATKRSAESLRAGERLMEAIDVADKARLDQTKYEEDLAYALDQLSPAELEKVEKSGKPLIVPPQKHFLMQGRDPVPYIIFTLRCIKSTELDEALLLLPFSHATRLFWYLEQVFATSSDDRHESQANGPASRLDTELAAKVTIALLRAHFKQLVSTHSLKLTLTRLRTSMRASLFDLQDLIGTNVAALQTLNTQIKDDSF